MKGFFPVAKVHGRRSLNTLSAKCDACGLFRSCRTPFMKVSGQGARKVLIVGEAPGMEEDKRGEPFIGPSGKLLEEALAKIGVDLRRDCWITNAAICRPPHNKLPDKAVEYCRPNVLRAIDEYQPETIILLGLRPVQSVVGWLWKPEVGTMTRWAGWQIPSQKINAWVCPTYHPSYILRSENANDSRVLRLFFERHLEKAFALTGRPWQKVPTWESQVEVIINPDHAVQAISEFVPWGRGPVAIDYETNMLKPDSKRAEIVSCSLSNGKKTIAYPWTGKAAKETQDFLLSELPKIASNFPFEERWTLAEFGHGVSNWFFDTMNGAHVLDTRSDITSIKFQAFVLLGFGAYNEYVEPYFKSKGSNDPNRIRELDLPSLLKYNGLDSLLEWHAAKVQTKQFGGITWATSKNTPTKN